MRAYIYAKNLLQQPLYVFQFNTSVQKVLFWKKDVILLLYIYISKMHLCLLVSIVVAQH